MNEDGELTLTQQDLLDGVDAQDVDGDTLSVTNVQVDPSLGTITDNGNGTWTFKPTEHFAHADAEGKLPITFDVTDGKTSVGASAEVHIRSEEHTSELQSRPHLVCRLLLEKKKNHKLFFMLAI